MTTLLTQVPIVEAIVTELDTELSREGGAGAGLDTSVRAANRWERSRGD